MKNCTLRFLLGSGLFAYAACGGAPGSSAPKSAAPVASALVPTEPISAPVSVEASPPAPPITKIGDAIVRKDDGVLLLEETAPIPDALRRRMARYLEVRGARLADISEDGRLALVATRFGETQQLHLVRGPLAARRQLTFGGEPVTDASFVPGTPVGKAIIFRVDAGGNENAQLFRMDLASGETRMLTDGKSRNGSPLWSWNGKRIAYRSNARNGVDFDVYVADGKSPSSAKIVAEGSGVWYPLAWSRDGKSLVVGEYVSVTESRLHLVDLPTNKVTRLSPSESSAAYTDARFSRDGKRIYVVSNREGEFAALYETDRAGASWRPLTPGVPWDVEAIALSGSGRYMAVVFNEGGVSTLRILDTRTRKLKPLRATIPKGRIGQLAFARKRDVLAMSLSGATSPGDVFTVAIGAGGAGKKLTRWTDSELGGLDRAALVEPTLIDFKSFDGAKIPALYFRPRGKGPFPVIVSIHGGPESQARPRFSAFTQFMVNERQTAVILPNVRGSTGYGKTYTTLDNGVDREDAVKDIGALLDWIGARPELDAGRVGVIGGSYGGYMVLASLVHYSNRISNPIKAGIDIVGISNFVTFLENTSSYRRALRRAEYGDERDPATRKVLESISPANNAQKIASPLFVAQGANDPRVPASEAKQIVEAVRANGQPVWYMLARNEGHGFAKKKNSDTFLMLSVTFFDKWLASLDK